MTKRTPSQRPHDFLDAGQLHEHRLTVSYTPIVDLTTQRVTPLARGSGGGGTRIVDPIPLQQHSFVTPVPHHAIEVPVLLGEPTLRPLEDIDVPNWRTLSGTIIILLYAMLVLSVFICLSRPDFNIVLYLLGYYVWCIDSKSHHAMEVVRPEIYAQTSELRLATKSTIKAATHSAILFSGAVIVDIAWIYLASSIWACDDKDTQKTCWMGVESKDLKQRMNATYHLHQFALFGSILNAIGKCIVILFSILWVLQQQRHHKGLNTFSTYPLTPHRHGRIHSNGLDTIE